MFAFKTLYEFNSESLRVFVQVDVFGKGESTKNLMLGEGVIPAGGSAFNPLANISISSRDTAVAFSNDKK